MARIRKTHRTIKTTRTNSEESSESDAEKNATKILRCNVLNSRRIYSVERNRRIFQNLRIYAGYFDNKCETITTNKKCLSCTILSNIRGKNWTCCNSKSTQTSNNELVDVSVRKISSSSTQTDQFNKIGDFVGDRDMKRSRSDTSVFTSLTNFNRKNNEPINDCAEDDSDYTNLRMRNQQIEKTSSSKTLITLHTNEKIHRNNKISPSQIPIPLKYSTKAEPEENNQQRKKKRNLFVKRKTRRLIHCSNTIRKSVEKLKQGDTLRHYSNCECKLNVTLYDELVNKMKKYSEITTEWSVRMFKIFSDMGIGLKKSLNNFYKMYEVQTVQSLTFCEYDKYRREIDRLTSKMNDLETTVKILTAKTETSSEKEAISRKLDRLDKEMESFASLKAEVENLKKQMKSGRATACATSFPPPPPPPMPPAPPVPIGCHSASSFIRVVQGDSKLRRFDHSRPIITLEDILKVKLKKISVTDM